LPLTSSSQRPVQQLGRSACPAQPLWGPQQCRCSWHELTVAQQQYFAHLGSISSSRSCQSCRASHTSSSRSSASAALRMRETAPDLILLLQSSSCCNSSEASTCWAVGKAASSRHLQSTRHRINIAGSKSHHAIGHAVKASRCVCPTLNHIQACRGRAVIVLNRSDAGRNYTSEAVCMSGRGSTAACCRAYSP
jgi:hypothetical protein